MALELRGYANFYQHEFGVRTPSSELETSFRSSWAGAGIFSRDFQGPGFAVTEMYLFFSKGEVAFL